MTTSTHSGECLDADDRLAGAVQAVVAAHEHRLGRWTPYARSGGAISETMVWDFLACVQDANPAYWSSEWATEHSPTGRVTVPPQMLLTHSRFPPGPLGTAAEWEPDYIVDAAEPDPLQSLLDGLRDAGLEYWTNAFRKERYRAPVHPGDTLETSALIEMSPVKSTWLGSGVFVNTRAHYRRTSDRRVVAESANALFVYGPSEPGKETDAAKPARHPRLVRADSASRPPTTGRATAFGSLDPMRIRRGDECPTLVLRPDYMDLLRAAQGTRHPVPIHTDRAYARAAGNRDAYFSTLWQAGILGRFVTDWSGPKGELTEMSFTMVDNICPGDHVAVAGVVTEVGEREIALELEMSTQYGVATTATAAVRFPAA